MSVITISRQYGSGGDEVADQLCQQLHYTRFDKRQIAQAALNAGLSDQEIVDYSEENYKVKTFLDILLRRSSPVAQVRIWKEDTSGARIAEAQTLSETAALMLVQKAVMAAYEIGNVVIVGRGGQAILKDYPDVLHIRMEAPIEERIYRVKAQIRAGKDSYLATIDDRREAQDLITARDTASASYLRQYYGVDWADPLLYHAVLNTGKLGIERTVRAIAALAGS
ncbi:MAG TPA: cytidylate kinase-like family protein [Anaerolineaceae bacterium]|nr:cytidylate kinase-like family protein [Anaerolineaceae bacterium]